MKDNVKYYKFLEELRKSGKTNMFGAAPYLIKAFPELEENEAKNIIVFWMEHYDETVKSI